MLISRRFRRIKDARSYERSNLDENWAGKELKRIIGLELFKCISWVRNWYGDWVNEWSNISWRRRKATPKRGGCKGILRHLRHGRVLQWLRPLELRANPRKGKQGPSMDNSGLIRLLRRLEEPS